MSTLFVLLMLASLILLIWGLISPASLAKHSKKPLSRRDAGVGFGVFAFIFMILAGITAPPQNNAAHVTATNTAKNLDQSKAASVKQKPVITTETVTETQGVPFSSTTVNDPARLVGTSLITTVGVPGIKTLTYEVSKADGVETSRKLVSEAITTPPVTQVTSIGTKSAPIKHVTPPPAPAPASNCDPNYTGACVPIASDVDCGNGSGNGPAYVYGTVKVVGVDIYDLDRDGNGYGCE